MSALIVAMYLISAQSTRPHCYVILYFSRFDFNFEVSYNVNFHYGKHRNIKSMKFVTQHVFITIIFFVKLEVTKFSKITVKYAN